MKQLLLVCTLFFTFIFATHAQKNQYSVGGNIYFPAAVPEESNSTGYGISISRQHFFNSHWSFDMNVGYIYFSGEFNNWDGNKENHFELIPVSIGARYYFKNFFAGLHAGLAIKGSSNAGTNLMFTPLVGYRAHRFQFEAKLLGIPQTVATIPEKTYLQKGGYSYIGIGLEYRL